MMSLGIIKLMDTTMVTMGTMDTNDEPAKMIKII